MKYLALYNPFADNSNGKSNAERLSAILTDDELRFVDITSIDDYDNFFSQIQSDENIILCGGDGTLNHFINNAPLSSINEKLYYYPCGSGNDFARDVNTTDTLIYLKDYVTNLPSVCIQGKEYRFINGVGFGIDGYCCEEGDKIRQETPEKKLNYTLIAIKGLLFDFKPVNATVTVDGKTYDFKKVWVAPTMFGRFYGGGMMPTPKQDRLNPQGKVSAMVFHGGKLKTLCIFPSIFKGTHVNKQKNVSVMEGDVITVRFDAPKALQIDGETFTNVIEYTVKSAFVTPNEN